MPLTHDQQSVQAFRPDTPNPSFRERIRARRAIRSADNFDTFACPDIIETRGELRVAVTDQEADRLLLILQGPRQLPRLLRHPFRRWVRCAARKMHAPTTQLDEEKYVKRL